MKVEYGETIITLSKEESDTIVKFNSIIDKLCSTLNDMNDDDPVIIRSEDDNFDTSVLADISELMSSSMFYALQDAVLK